MEGNGLVSEEEKKNEVVRRVTLSRDGFWLRHGGGERAAKQQLEWARITRRILSNGVLSLCRRV